MARSWKLLTAAMLVTTTLLSFSPFNTDAAAAAATAGARESLINFLRTLSGDADASDRAVQQLRWSASVAPCDATSPWRNVNCTIDGRVKRIVLERMSLAGTINASLLCSAAGAGDALHVLSVKDNAIHGGLPADIAKCSSLASLYLAGNNLSGPLPPSLGELRDLTVLDVSRNNFSGEIPDGLSKVGLRKFLASGNHFAGEIPAFDLANFVEFDVSNNNLTGEIPPDAGKFGAGNFSGNADGMCGEPLFAPCPSPPASSGGRREEHGVVVYLGYILLAAGVVAFVLYVLCCSKNRSRKRRIAGAYESSKPTTSSATTPTKSVPYSQPMPEEKSAAVVVTAARAQPSPSLVVLQRSAAEVAAKGMRLEELLKSPAELLGRGRFGSAYKVVVGGAGGGAAALVVKRVKDAAAVEEEGEFRRRMERVGKARHPSVMPPLAFYCAMQEKLVVYEFMSNGSLAKLLHVHGSTESSQITLDWPARLHIAAKVADGMAFMHDALLDSGDLSFSSSAGDASSFVGGAIAHGNLKSSNILFTATMDPCISEYGITAAAAGLRADVRAYGVLLLELLTGKPAAASEDDGAELARWVTSVIREEWTAEVFDRRMLSSGDAVASEQRMVRLLQVAMRCVDDAAAPPTMREVAGMVNAIGDDGEDDRSVSLEA
uniref:Protein kinase domain-containing protein n=1 Tax=Leersia perrieri TaxID=77586 RepID=A0A0D9XD78_9ORYZ